MPGSSEEPDSHGYRDSESAKNRRQFWNNTWRAFGGFAGADAQWNFNSNPSTHSTNTGRPCNSTIGSPADRLALGLAPAGPLSLDELKFA